jgi:hypothetical protein
VLFHVTARDRPFVDVWRTERECCLVLSDPARGELGVRFVIEDAGRDHPRRTGVHQGPGDEAPRFADERHKPVTGATHDFVDLFGMCLVLANDTEHKSPPFSMTSVRTLLPTEKHTPRMGRNDEAQAGARPARVFVRKSVHSIYPRRLN